MFYFLILLIFNFSTVIFLLPPLD